MSSRHPNNSQTRHGRFGLAGQLRVLAVGLGLRASGLGFRV